MIGLVPAEDMKPGDLVGVNKDSYLILDTLPCEYDSRVKAMEVDEKPEEEYTDIGGLDKQIQELVEAIVLPMTHKERFIAIGIKPPKGCLMYGPPGTGTFVDDLAFRGSGGLSGGSPTASATSTAVAPASAPSMNHSSLREKGSELGGGLGKPPPRKQAQGRSKIGS